MCQNKKKCSCGCSINEAESKKSPYKMITVFAKDAEGTIEDLLNSIKKIGNQGHGFEIEMDKDLKAENEEDGIKTHFYWDGDGSDDIEDVVVTDISAEEYKGKKMVKEMDDPSFLVSVHEDMGKLPDGSGFFTGTIKENLLKEYNDGSKEVLSLFTKHYKLQDKLNGMLNGKFAGFSKVETDLNKKVQNLKLQGWDIARKSGLDTNEIMSLDKLARQKATGKKKMTESDEADYYENFAKDLRKNGKAHGAEVEQGKAEAARRGKLVDGEIVESKGLNEASKVSLRITSNTKRDLIKKAKTALDAIYSIYDICERLNIDNQRFIDFIDEAFEGVNECLTVLVTTDSVENK